MTKFRTRKQHAKGEHRLSVFTVCVPDFCPDSGPDFRTRPCDLVFSLQFRPLNEFPEWKLNMSNSRREIEAHGGAYLDLESTRPFHATVVQRYLCQVVHFPSVKSLCPLSWTAQCQGASSGLHLT